MTEQPRILVFTGEGKGKTTAALGMALRAAGHGMRVLVLQFVKQDATTGEMEAVESIENIDIVQTGRGFVPSPEHSHFAEHREAAQTGFARAVEAIRSGKYTLVVLDEICIAVARGLVPEKDVLELLNRLADEMILVLTGRDATPGLIDRADTVSEIRCIKHALETGQPAQKGVER
ncbi:MAG: cob(I)yrinic acid a,c-diamide adenosyltransferase [Planctomycetota bacterium]|jgi:cob(I)alamin adenosyltransferase